MVAPDQVYVMQQIIYNKNKVTPSTMPGSLEVSVSSNYLSNQKDMYKGSFAQGKKDLSNNYLQINLKSDSSAKHNRAGKTLYEENIFNPELMYNDAA